ncbi:CLUMA_CG008950, isoform A [Clunio marinus]|uniref:CLUMA_CG008950, isoform A n=1 Tax=Clunio marinus TaxID=568069 RepID=A0A1J1IAM6_9DIPT|nr:CLUMA_CG008950, isoform A [Clunio marinus]
MNFLVNVRFPDLSKLVIRLHYSRYQHTKVSSIKKHKNLVCLVHLSQLSVWILIRTSNRSPDQAKALSAISNDLNFKESNIFFELLMRLHWIKAILKTLTPLQLQSQFMLIPTI